MSKKLSIFRGKYKISFLASIMSFVVISPLCGFLLFTMGMYELIENKRGLK